MGITVADCMKLTALRESKVVAGSKGMNNIVASISVLEYADVASLVEVLFMGSELVITGLITIKDDVPAQCAVVRHLYEMGEVGLILYYVGIFIPRLDERVVRTADELGFPLILMPENRRDLRYSEVIYEVMEAIFKDRLQETYFVNEMLERISMLQGHQRTIVTVLRMISDRIRCSILLTDRSFTALNIAAWPMAATLNEQEVLDYYKNRPAAFLETSPGKLMLNEKEVFVDCQPVVLENGFIMNVIIISESAAHYDDITAQAAEVIQLFVNIWRLNNDNSGCAELFRAIMNDDPVKMRRLAEILHVDVASIHVMWVIKSEDKNLPAKKQAGINTKLLIKTKAFLQEHNRVAMVDIFEGSIVGFMSNPACIDQVNSLAETFMEETRDADMKVSLTLCSDLQNTAEVREAYMMIIEYFESARVIYPHKRIITIEEVRFACRCRMVINQGEKAVARQLLPLRPLRGDDAKQEKELVITLETYLLDAQTNVQLAGRLLFLHKNTIKYRLGKINERLNYNVLKLPEAYDLYTAVALERLLRESN